MTSSAGISHNPAAHAASIAALPDAGSANSTGDSSTISANDFLTLLVTEMQNQDPTNATDPNEYINQLVGVNSLEQLIQINQTLSGALMTTGNVAPPSSAASSAASSASHTDFPPASVVHGNLNLPAVNPSAQRVAQALAPPPRA